MGKDKKKGWDSLGFEVLKLEKFSQINLLRGSLRNKRLKNLNLTMDFLFKGRPYVANI